MSIITTKDLDLYYGKNQALKKINMDINKNEVKKYTKTRFFKYKL